MSHVKNKVVPVPATPEDKLNWEVAKLIAETENLRKPWIMIPASWIAIVTTILAIAGVVTQANKSVLDAQLAETKTVQSKNELNDAVASKKKVLEEKQVLSQQVASLKSQAIRLHAVLAKANANQKSPDPLLVQALDQALSLSTGLTDVASSLPKVTIGSTVTLEIASENERAKANELRVRLQQIAKDVAKVENVGIIQGIDIPSTIEIRYGKGTDYKDVNLVVNEVKTKFPNQRIKAFYEPLVKEFNTIQIWFPHKI